MIGSISSAHANRNRSGVITLGRRSTRLETGDQPRDPQDDDGTGDGHLEDPRRRRAGQRVRDVVVVALACDLGRLGDEGRQRRAHISERGRGGHGMVVTGGVAFILRKGLRQEDQLRGGSDMNHGGFELRG